MNEKLKFMANLSHDEISLRNAIAEEYEKIVDLITKPEEKIQISESLIAKIMNGKRESLCKTLNDLKIIRQNLEKQNNKGGKK